MLTPSLSPSLALAPSLSPSQSLSLSHPHPIPIPVPIPPLSPSRGAWLWGDSPGLIQTPGMAAGGWRQPGPQPHDAHSRASSRSPRQPPASCRGGGFGNAFGWRKLLLSPKIPLRMDGENSGCWRLGSSLCRLFQSGFFKPGRTEPPLFCPRSRCCRRGGNVTEPSAPVASPSTPRHVRAGNLREQEKQTSCERRVTGDVSRLVDPCPRCPSWCLLPPQAPAGLKLLFLFNRAGIVS